MSQRDLDLLMGIALFLASALFAVLARAFVLMPDPATVYVFGPSVEPECVASAREARERKRLEEEDDDE